LTRHASVATAPRRSELVGMIFADLKKSRLTNLISLILVA
jgi:hypothetical protein